MRGSESNGQEAVIKFDGESSASTACLLNNALVDGSHITVKALIDDADKPAPSTTPNPGASPKPGSPANSLLSSILTASKSMASSIAESAKQLDEKYQVSSTVSSAAQTAWTATRDTAISVDEKLKISETTSKRTPGSVAVGAD